MNFLELDIATLRNNISIIKRYTQTKLCLPVKANAYGHDLNIVVKNTKDLVDFYATACASEALEVYKNASTMPILIFGVIETCYLKELIDKEIRLSIHRFRDIQEIEYYAKQSSKKAKVHIFANTGMNMLGINSEHIVDVVEKIQRSKYIDLEGVYSHLACADEKDNFFNQIQIDRFIEIQKFVKSVDNQIMCHLANSYGCIGQNEISFDMVRPGILSYGFLPDFSVSKQLEAIKPVASLVTQIVKLIKLDKIFEVGYSISYVGKKDEYIAILPVGYGDGFPRALGNNGFVYIKDKYYPIVGRVNMDALAISLGCNEQNFKVGEKVELISNKPARLNSAKAIAKNLQTIEYDVIATLNQRIIRRET
ncbi:alanine racemase [Francisella sp. LA112445]|uniref:alanine racemase n=1 Tax=Francisella sp. LA112445 TaxID=1395624 RepID=UPI001788A783|nr:alanine racemase [Francisella sp. LA112445]QIW11093.1 alanine racemase [Francisella sp. LA112445]